MPATSFAQPSLFDRPPKRVKSRRPPRPKLFGTEDPCAVVRGILIATLDRAYCEGELGRVLWRDAESRELVTAGLDALAAVQLALFPEEFATDRGLAARIAAANAGREPDSLVPPGGPKRAGGPRLEAFAAALRRSAAGVGRNT